MIRLRTCCVGLAMLVAGCERTAPSTPGTVTDSAGIAIVETVVIPSTQWSATLERTIGEEDGRDEYVFGRIADVDMDSRDRIVVLDQLGHSVRVYDAAGAHVMDIGRSGQGPGEFSDFVNAVLVGTADSLFVPDYPQSRVSVFDPDGRFARSISLPPVPNGHSWAWGGSRGLFYRGMTISRNAENRFEFWDAIMRVGLDGGPVDTIVPFTYVRTDIGGPGNIRVPLIVNSPFWDVLPNGSLVWGATDTPEIYVHAASGALQSVVRHAAWTSQPVTDGDGRAMVELLRAKLEMLGGVSEAADGPNVEAPEFLPAITGVRSGPDGTIWVQRMGAVEEIDPWGINAPNRPEWLGGATWDILGADGLAVATIVMPPDFRIVRILGDRILGVQKDDLDVERVLVLRVERG